MDDEIFEEELEEAFEEEEGPYDLPYDEVLDDGPVEIVLVNPPVDRTSVPSTYTYQGGGVESSEATVTESGYIQPPRLVCDLPHELVG